MRFVLDANLVEDWFLPGQQNAATGAVFDAYRASAIQFVAPKTLAVEFAHALGKQLRRNPRHAIGKPRLTSAQQQLVLLGLRQLE